MTRTLVHLMRNNLDFIDSETIKHELHQQNSFRSIHSSYHFTIFLSKTPFRKNRSALLYPNHSHVWNPSCTSCSRAPAHSQSEFHFSSRTPSMVNAGENLPRPAPAEAVDTFILQTGLLYIKAFYPGEMGTYCKTSNLAI